MKKKLILMRHGEAESQNTTDHCRQLTAHGKSQVERVARKLANLSLGTVSIICSDAARALETAQIVAKCLHDCPVELHPEFYLGDYRVIMAAVSEKLGYFDCLIAIGHNPTWSSAVGVFSSRTASLSTAEAAVLELDDTASNDWQIHLEDFHLGEIISA